MKNRITIASYLLIVTLIFVSSITMVTVFAEGQDIMNNMISGLTKSIMPEIGSAGRLSADEEKTNNDSKSTTDSALSNIGNIGDTESNDKTTSDSALDASASGADGNGSMDSIMNAMTDTMSKAATSAGNDMDKINKMLGIFSGIMAMMMLVSVMKMAMGMMFGDSKSNGGKATKELGLDQLFSGADNKSADGAVASDGTIKNKSTDDSDRPAPTDATVIKLQDDIEALPFKDSSGSVVDEGLKVTAVSPFVTLAEIIKKKIDNKEAFSANNLISEMDSEGTDLSGSIDFMNSGSNWSQIKAIFGKYFPKNAEVINTALNKMKATADSSATSNKSNPDADLPSAADNAKHDAAIASQPDDVSTAEGSDANTDSVGETTDVTDTATPEAP